MTTTQKEEMLQVRFTLMIGRDGKPVLAYCLAGPFLSATFASESGAPFESTEKMAEALNRVGLPAKEIISFSDKEYSVTATHLRDLGLKYPELPGWVKQANTGKEQSEAQANEQAQKIIGDSILIGEQGPVVWQRFIKGLS